MSEVRKFIDNIELRLPDPCTTQDLVDAKLFSSPFEAMMRRKQGQPPEFLYLSKRRIVYPKSGVLAWLKDQSEKGNSRGKD